ncbi:MAG: bacteriohopanetetrol glucosamine biosynthesis glycosyltransferase HpnI [Blastocatellia bacterium]|nr:bacteriohopanetetrol glucosamine biosynthesis glycosyltransferase HpnI [Blastocatellia bacterium]
MMTSFYYLLCGIFGVAVLGGIAYHLIAVYCAFMLARKRAASPPAATDALPPMSLLKPLCGAEPELEQCIESFFKQDYPEYEILFAVRDGSDPAVDVVDNLRRRYPHISVTMLYTGEPTYVNPQVYSLHLMAEAARHSILVTTDSDTSVAPDYLRALAREFAPPRVGVVTNLYRGVSGTDLWSKLEALGMSTEFMAGVVVAERLDGMKFALGPSMSVRAECLNEVGKFSGMKDYLADDFILGSWADRAGWQVVLSDHVINHHASSAGFITTFKHRLRWNRSARFSRPSGYIGQGFIYGWVWAVLFFLLSPAWWSFALLALALILRCWQAIQVGAALLKDRSSLRNLWLLPLQDLISYGSWVGGFLGKEIVWRNERYRLLSGGRFKLLAERVGVTKESFNTDSD